MWFRYEKESVVTDESKINEILSRGVVELIDEGKLRSMLLSGKKLRIKLGIDPTSPYIHIGRAVSLWKLKAFQELGHTIIFIIGDFTSTIGDTSDKDSERPMLSKETVASNLKEYFQQAGKIIDMSRVEKYYNSSWLKKLSYEDIGEQANLFSVSDFIARDNIKRRLQAGTRVSLREVLYPLMQGYDSVKVQANVEIGGSDQRFNLLAGRTMQPYYKQEPQQLLMTKLLLGIDGRKMSSSWGNTINVTDSPQEMFGKTMRIKDELIEDFFELATRVPVDEYKAIIKNAPNPKDAKMHLAREIVGLYYGRETTERASNDFVKMFSQKEAPEDIREVLSAEGSTLADVLLQEKLVASKTEFSRLVQSGAVVLLPDSKVTDIKSIVVKGGVYKIGKHRFIKIK